MKVDGYKLYHSHKQLINYNTFDYGFCIMVGYM